MSYIPMSWLAGYSAGVSSCTCTSQAPSMSATGTHASRMSLSMLSPSLLADADRSEEHTSELQSPCNLVCRLLLEKKKKSQNIRVLFKNDPKKNPLRVCDVANTSNRRS